MKDSRRNSFSYENHKRQGRYLLMLYSRMSLRLRQQDDDKNITMRNLLEHSEFQKLVSFLMLFLISLKKRRQQEQQ